MATKLKLGDEFVGVSGLRAWITEMDDESVTFVVERVWKQSIERRERLVLRTQVSFFLSGYKRAKNTTRKAPTVSAAHSQQDTTVTTQTPREATGDG